MVANTSEKMLQAILHTFFVAEQVTTLVIFTLVSLVFNCMKLDTSTVERSSIMHILSRQRHWSCDFGPLRMRGLCVHQSGYCRVIL